MKSILTADQIRATEQHTIETVPIASINLMENAATAFADVIETRYGDRNTGILICCGTGNNGGDGLAVARLLQARGYHALAVWVIRFSDKEREEFATNLNRLHHTPVPITEFFPGDELPPITQEVIIDALLGAGLNKPLEGDWLRIANHINESRKHVIAVDIPTGLRADGIMPDAEQAIYAHDTVSFQRPKISFFFPESAKAMARFRVVDIGLDETFMEQLPVDFRVIETQDVQRIYRPRQPFSHKGTYGHALIVAGSESRMGAALLSSGASLYSGAGLVTACIPKSGLTTLNMRYPEVMYCTREELASRRNMYNAIALGPGLGDCARLLETVLSNAAKPLVLDADAISAISEDPSLVERLPPGCILTPHMKEFDRLFGQHANWWTRIQTARKTSSRHRVIIVLKNRYTFIVLPEGQIWINPTGNAAMATGGSGDVLTGMLAAFLAQGYTAQDAAVLACYIHGAAGDQLASQGMAVVPASLLIQQIPLVMGSFEDRGHDHHHSV